MFRLAILMCAAAILLPVTVSASDPRLPVVSVTGVGQVSAVPDMARIDMGVTQENAVAAEAIQAAATRAADILAKLDDADIDEKDVQTSAVTLSPVWSQASSSDNGPEITGFRATISMSVRVRELGRLGEILDAVVADGANQLGGIRFALQNPETTLNEARKKAVADAQAKAALYAEAAGVELGHILSIVDQTGGVRPESMAMASARDASVPIAAGEVTFTARIQMEYLIAP